jgi:hypothetical protein
MLILKFECEITIFYLGKKTIFNTFIIKFDAL